MDIPRARGLDQSFAFLREGSDLISNRCEELGSDPNGPRQGAICRSSWAGNLTGRDEVAEIISQRSKGLTVRCRLRVDEPLSDDDAPPIALINDETAELSRRG